MSIRESMGGLCVLAMLSCSGEVDTPDVPDDGTDPTAKAGSQEPQARNRRRRTGNRSGSAAAPSGGNIVSRQTSDGETIRVLVPEPAPTQEVPPGAPCGVLDANGVLMSCAPGSYCLSAGEGQPGRCQEAPRAPRSEG
jgi:hypothetical protein